ncbi:hypothetical protein B5G34_16235 [Flavonifractor sp. An82]|nr:hypothetical protein B5G34_16235 [Flavonifractor sp. An82]
MLFSVPNRLFTSQPHTYGSKDTALDIYSLLSVGTWVSCQKQLLVEQVNSPLQATSAGLITLKQEMPSLAFSLAKYYMVMRKFYINPFLLPQLMA